MGDFFINTISLFMTKVLPFFALVFAYIYAGITFSPFPILESTAKEKVNEILKKHYANTQLSYLRRSTNSGQITSYHEFEIALKNENHNIVFWKINYKDFTKENLNPNPTFNDVNNKIKRVLSQLKLEDLYEVSNITYTYHTIMKKDILNAFDIKLINKKSSESFNFKSIYMHEINEKRIKKLII